MYMEAKSVVKHGLGLLLAALCVFIFASGAGAADVIKIGISGPMKFPAGEHMFIGAQLAAEEINAKGGVNISGKSYKVEIVKADSNEYLSVPDAVSALERLLTVDKVNFVIGGARSEAILAQQEVMAENKTIYIMSGGKSLNASPCRVCVKGSAPTGRFLANNDPTITGNRMTEVQCR